MRLVLESGGGKGVSATVVAVDDEGVGATGDATVSRDSSISGVKSCILVVWTNRQLDLGSE